MGGTTSPDRDHSSFPDSRLTRPAHAALGGIRKSRDQGSRQAPAISPFPACSVSTK
jgi:hypothetical protein